MLDMLSITDDIQSELNHIDRLQRSLKRDHAALLEMKAAGEQDSEAWKELREYRKDLQRNLCLAYEDLGRLVAQSVAKGNKEPTK